MNGVWFLAEGLGGHSAAHQERMWWFVVLAFLGAVLAMWRFYRHCQARAELEAAEEILEQEAQ